MAKKTATTAEEPIEKQLWKAADKLRKNIDAAEYKHVVLGLIFLKYISDAFEELYARLKEEEINGADPEDKDEYSAENVFFVPQDARWSLLQSKAKQPQIGKIVDDAIYGQESNQTTWRLAKMNLAIRGIDSSQVKWNNEGSFLNDAHKDLKAEFEAQLKEEAILNEVIMKNLGMIKAFGDKNDKMINQ